ncbi:MAG: hypothetical protein LQ345_001817 [Seirophora villosa]|nr:MAG: hypothetical protein LQ345_001817 [Seirophora villosa]
MDIREVHSGTMRPRKVWANTVINVTYAGGSSDKWLERIMLGKNTILTAFTSIRQNKSVFIEIGFTLYSQWHNQPLYICDQNANRSNIVPHVGPNSEAHSELVILIQASVTPSAAKSLLDKGYTINVERSPARIFKDEEFEAAGATLVPEGSWPTVPESHLILGLKELPEEDTPLKHTHIQFAHCYKQQSGWQQVLRRFPRGGGTLYDLEFLTDPKGRRVAAFGSSAGYCGAALALLAYSHQLLHPSTPLPSVSAYPNQAALISALKTSLSSALPHASRPPRILIIGALGRCGNGAVRACTDAGIPATDITKWDMAETARGGPFAEIAEADIFVNCVYLGDTPIPPFVTKPQLRRAGKEGARNLSVVCDVSCDPTSPNNPVRIYDTWTSFTDPTVRVELREEHEHEEEEKKEKERGGKPLSVIAIDHLPSLLPREASEDFCRDLLPSLLLLDRRHEAPVWVGAEKLFLEKVKGLDEEGGRG